MIAFIITLALTLYMSGMIWSMQILEYPLFALVGQQEFPAYHRRHNRGLPFLVILPSIGAFLSAVVLIFTRPARLSLWVSIVVAVLDVFIIVATVAREAPVHAQLDRDGYSPTLIRQLVQGNWIRTLLWSINAVILLIVTAQFVSAAS